MKNKLLKSALLFSLLIFLGISNSTCKKGINNQNHNCPQGQHWDDAQQKCVDDSTSSFIDTAISDDLTEDEYQSMLQLEDTLNPLTTDLLLPDSERVIDYLSQDFLNTYPSNAVATTLNVENGQSETLKTSIQLLNTILAEMTRKAQWLSNATGVWNKNDEGANRPAQEKLGYITGSKGVDKRNKAPECQDYLYGLDCSGFLSFIFNTHGITSFPTGNAENQRQTPTIQTAIKNVLPLNKFEIFESPTNYSKDNLLPGDIIYFFYDGKQTAEHIGFIGKTDKQIFFYHSFGSSSKCERNKSINGGPIAWTMNKIPKGLISQGHTINYKISRIRYIAEIEKIQGPINENPGAENKIKVKVYSSDKLPKVNFPVKFETTDGSVTSIVKTDNNGIAEATWKLGNSADEQTCVASVISPYDNTTLLDSVNFKTSSSKTDSQFIYNANIVFYNDQGIPTNVTTDMTLILKFDNGNVIGKATGNAFYNDTGSVTGSISGTQMNLVINYDMGVIPHCQNGIGFGNVKMTYTTTGTTNAAHSSYTATFKRTRTDEGYYNTSCEHYTQTSHDNGSFIY